jgi:benzoate-CoA ligase family protein
VSYRDWSTDVNLFEHLVVRHVRANRGSSPALHYEHATWSYADLADVVLRTATVLRDHGCAPNDRVVLLLPDTPTFVAVFLAALHIGAIAVPVNPAFSLGDVGEVVQQTRPVIIVIDASIMEKFRPLAGAGCEFVSAGDCQTRRGDLERRLEAAGRDSVASWHSADAIAYCLFSSGTTGAPKGIPHRHSDILECIKAYSLPVLNMSSDDRVLAVPKLCFGYGLGGNLLSSLFVGGSSILVAPSSSSASITAAAEQHAPTLFLSQPRLLADLLESNCLDAFRRLRLAVTAGEVLVPALYQRWRNSVGCELLDGFGSTEVGHVFITNRVGDVRPGCAGRPVQGFSVRIADENGDSLPTSAVGEMWVTGPSLARGYWNDIDRTKRHFVGGWVRTGDMASHDEEGYVQLCGRVDDMIKAGCGQWVSPSEIEALIASDPAVTDCAVVGHSDSLGVVRPKAYVVLRSELRPNAEIGERLKTLVASRFDEMPYKHIDAVEFVTELPRGATGKLQRFRLKPTTLTDFSYQC